MKITESQIIELLEGMEIDFDGYGDEIVVEHSAWSGRDYVITMIPMEDGVEFSTSKGEHDGEDNVRTIKTMKGLKSAIEKIVKR